MRHGHNEAQLMFEALGRRLGYQTRRTWRPELPTDGVWFAEAGFDFEELPLVAVEVVVSESSKSLKGSIITLEEVSPALGVILLQDQEIRRGLVRAGLESAKASKYVERKALKIQTQLNKSRQRFDMWTFSQLRRHYELATGRRSLLRVV